VVNPVRILRNCICCSLPAFSLDSVILADIRCHTTVPGDDRWPRFKKEGNVMNENIRRGAILCLRFVLYGCQCPK
jgi:hypothetical protein